MPRFIRTDPPLPKEALAILFIVVCVVVSLGALCLCAPAPTPDVAGRKFNLFDNCYDACVYRLLELEQPHTEDELDDALDRASDCVMRCYGMKERFPPMYYKYRIREASDGDYPVPVQREGGCSCRIPR